MAFDEIAPRLVSDLMRDFGLTREQAIGFAGNFAYESGGFGKLQEEKPVVPGSRGGYGYAQWTGPRRKAYESYAKGQGLDPSSYDANYGFIKHELSGSHKRSLSAIKKARTAEEATRAAMDSFFIPGKPNLGERNNWTGRVASAYVPIPGANMPGVATLTDTARPARPPGPAVMSALGQFKRSLDPMPSRALPAPKPLMFPARDDIDPMWAAHGKTGAPVQRIMPPMPRPRVMVGADPGMGGLTGNMRMNPMIAPQRPPTGMAPTQWNEITVPSGVPQPAPASQRPQPEQIMRSALQRQAQAAMTPAGGFQPVRFAGEATDVFGNDMAFQPRSVRASVRQQTGY